MDCHNRKFIASSELFSGFSTNINITKVSSLDDVCEQFKQNLKDVLEKYHFENLIRKLNNCKFHVHSYSIEDILTSDINNIFYVCDHC